MTQEKDDNIYLTPEQAISALADGEYVHSFVNSGGLLLGADHSRKQAIETINSASALCIAGQFAKGMKHAIIVHRRGVEHPLYYASKPDVIEKLEKKLSK